MILCHGHAGSDSLISHHQQHPCVDALRSRAALRCAALRACAWHGVVQVLQAHATHNTQHICFIIKVSSSFSCLLFPHILILTTPIIIWTNSSLLREGLYLLLPFLPASSASCSPKAGDSPFQHHIQHGTHRYT